MQRQSGAVMMIMLIILIIGSAAFLVTSLTNAALSIARDSTTSDVLAQAREALLGYAASDPNRPGELPCPDFNNDGQILIADDYSGSNCKSLVGWLPWKTLGLPELRDANGNHLWYALADPFHANSSAILNSDTPTTYPTKMLTVINSATGATLASNVVAIVFSPSTALAGQIRSPIDNNASSSIPNYLEGDNAILGTTVFQTANDKLIPLPTPTINDRLLTIDRDSLFQIIERRITREVKGCLDNYASTASNTNNRYPWAVPVIDATAFPNRTGAYATYFGRVPEIPNTGTTSGSTPPTGTLLTYIQAVQTALNNYISNPNSTTLSTLQGKGDALKDYATSGTSAYNAGLTANNCIGMSCTSPLQSQLNTAMGGGTPDSTMPSSWPPSCTLFASTYWPDWRDLVFYQVAVGYQPGGGTFTPIQINGSGTYRATVSQAGRKLGTQTRSNAYTDPPNDYLANTTSEFSADPLFVINAHNNTTLTTTFISYKSSDPYNQNVNDLVLCLDGKGINLTSQCN